MFRPIASENNLSFGTGIQSRFSIESLHISALMMWFRAGITRLRPVTAF